MLFTFAAKSLPYAAAVFDQMADIVVQILYLLPICLIIYLVNIQNLWSALLYTTDSVESIHSEPKVSRELPLTSCDIEVEAQRVSEKARL